MAEEKSARNFIEEIIDEDNASGRYGGVVYTRFPPEPNGYLHIGHAKSICLNFGTAMKYSGKCNLRYDDTNPGKEDVEFVNSIEEDVKWLGFSWAKRCWASDYFDLMYSYAMILIEKGKAYVDDLSADEIREYRGTLTEPGRESAARTRSVEENKILFEEMKAGKFADGEKVLRAKIDMASPNMNMRDPVIYRISHAEHHNTGTKWCIYPMYDFAHPVEDAIEGITHSLCTLEFEDHRPLYDWVLREIGIWEDPPRQIEFARLDLTDTVTSKRKLKALVDDGFVEGWDDPRMPTIAGMRRRGFTPEAIRNFCDEIGIAKANSLVDIAELEHFVRDDLAGKTESRHVAFDPIKIVITNYPEGKIEQITVENNKNVPEMGTRTVPFSRELYIDGEDFMEVPVKKYFRMFPGNEVRLKGAYYVRCNEIVKNPDGSVKELLCTYDPESRGGETPDGRKVRGTIHFVEASTAVKIRIRNYEHLYITDEHGEQVLNEHSVSEEFAFAEPSVGEAEPGERFQFFRHGYYIADSKLNKATEKANTIGDAEMAGTAGEAAEEAAAGEASAAGTAAGGRHEKVFNRIVGLKSSWKPAK